MGFADPSRMDGNPQSFSEAVDEAEDDAAFAFDALPFAVLGFARVIAADDAAARGASDGARLAHVPAAL